ncbi:vanadium-dependent haloperoxidase [Fibrella rubiginis]|nr:vanadium-dependent haloperoxidase [Fibrella rubiginis]
MVALQACGGITYQHALLASHTYAMVHMAMFFALNAIAPTYQPDDALRKDAQAAPVAAAAKAAHDVLAGIFPEKLPMLDSALIQSLTKVPVGESLNRGLALGGEAAAVVLKWRDGDGAMQNPAVDVAASTEAGVYQTVPPFTFVFAPFWRTMKPFGLKQPDQFRSLPHPTLNSTVYTTAFDEVKAVGSIVSQTRTPDQTAYAKFWYEFSEIGWNRIARTVAADRKLDLLATARLFALLNMAMADAYISGWDAKFHYNFWRPYTAIRGAATDGNAATSPDPAWEPLMPTPPVQDYPSTHSALGNAAAVVLAHVFGDKTRFIATSTTADPVTATRSFSSFSQAAKENADSRVMAGIHFRFSCEAGLELGRNVGQWTVHNHLRPRLVGAK